MGNLAVNMFATLDGVLQAPGMPDEDRDGGFTHGGWQVPYLSDEFMLDLPDPDAIAETLRRVIEP